ncbi:hypothetical protein P7K49_021702 [Saguinus oedipus]|uniref:Uncharacterized protein n=1 Tax=Saguinus oedipus TaxID=9490 RepID=A0ABQ9UTD6_SAGOE|nr:hypothetical protein P7K49_021702 [Saguinus oedipus]
MPRHNYSRVAPLVKSLCAKHGLSYEVKPFLTALVDIVSARQEEAVENWVQEGQLPRGSCLNLALATVQLPYPTPLTWSRFHSRE